MCDPSLYKTVVTAQFSVKGEWVFCNGKKFGRILDISTGLVEVIQRIHGRPYRYEVNVPVLAVRQIPSAVRLGLVMVC